MSASKSFAISTTKHLSTGSTCPPSKPGLLRCYSMKYCPYAQRTRLVLAHKQIEHEVVNIHLKKKPEWFVEKFPLSKVPALELNGEFIYESLVTADYLNEIKPDPPLHNSDSWQKAKDRCLVDTLSLITTPLHRLFYMPDKSQAPEYLKDIEKGLLFFENELQKRGTSFFNGKEIGMVDYMIWPWYERLPLVRNFVPGSIPDDKFPILTKWAELMMKDPAIQAVFISGEEHIAFSESRVDGIPDYDLEFTPSKI